MYSRRKVESRALTLGLISIISSGCAAGISSHPHGLGAGEWNVTLPATASYSQGLAYGRGGSSARAEIDDAALFAEAHTTPVLGAESKKKHVQRKRRVDQAPPTRSEPAPAPEQTPVVPAPAKQERTELAFANTAELGRYEAREAQSQTQQKFAGGDAIVIGASTLVIIILIVLLVLLLL